jgi:hypothetical protein
MTLVYHNDCGFDLDSVISFEADAHTNNLLIHLRGQQNPLVLSLGNGRGQAALACLQSRATLIKPPAPAPSKP